MSELSMIFDEDKKYYEKSLSIIRKDLQKFLLMFENIESI